MTSPLNVLISYDGKTTSPDWPKEIEACGVKESMRSKNEKLNDLKNEYTTAGTQMSTDIHGQLTARTMGRSSKHFSSQIIVSNSNEEDTKSNSQGLILGRAEGTNGKSSHN